MSNAYDDVQVRVAKKLATIIQAAQPNAKVYHYWILGQGAIGESLPDMLSNAETEWSSLSPTYVPWAHAYIIGDEEESSEKITNARRRDFMTFKLWGFYGFLKGDASHNSTDVFRKHRTIVKNALTAATKLQDTTDPNGVPEVEKHGEWQISQVGVYWMGDTAKAHIAQGTITVNTSILINPVPISV